MPVWAVEGQKQAETPKLEKATKPEPEVPAKTKMALKLAGLMTFVASSCPELQPDYTRFKSALRVLGVTPDDLERKDLKGAYLTYTMRYKEDAPKNCARALTEFGPGGHVVADLVRAKGK